MRKSVIYLLLLTMVFAGIVVMGGSDKAGASMTCTLPLLATGTAATWCAATNGSTDNATLTLTVLGQYGASASTTLPTAVTTSSATDAIISKETAVYYFKGKAMYKGFATDGTAVASTTALSLLPESTTGGGFYGAKFRMAGTASTANITTSDSTVSCFQLDPAGAKRPLIVNCQNY
jgi:hypothetical protein